MFHFIFYDKDNHFNGFNPSPIYETLQILKEQLENFFVETGLGKIVVLDNISLLESGSTETARIEGK